MWKLESKKIKQTLHLNALTNWIIILNVDFVSIYHCLHVINWQRLGDMQQNYCEFKLSRDIEKNPGSTPVYIDPSKTIAAPYIQGYQLIFGRNAMSCNEFVFFDLL